MTIYNNSSKVSIIISTLNSGTTLENCIKSILKQTYKNIELIIIDGGSTDGSINILERFSNKIDFWITERDTGIYNAWNKAIPKTTGDWLCFIGSDDILLPDSVARLVDLAIYPQINFVSSRVMMVDNNGNEVGAIGRSWNNKDLSSILRVVHCGALHHQSLFQNNQFFNDSYKIAGDYEFLIRAGKNIRSAFLDGIIVRMCNQGVSKRNVNKVIWETTKILFNSENFSKIASIRYFISAHLRNIFWKIVFLSPGGKQLFAFKNK